MKAALAFARASTGLPIARLRCSLLGSLAWTGEGHSTDKAVVLGLAGHAPDTIEPDEVDSIYGAVRNTGRLSLGGRAIDFDPERDIVFDRDAPAPAHPNTLVLEAWDSEGSRVAHQRWCSIGGGFVVIEADVGTVSGSQETVPPFPFRSAAELVELGARHGLSIAQIVRANELSLLSASGLDAYLDKVIAAMMACIDRGMATEGILPGRLGVPRRAAKLRRDLDRDRLSNCQAPHAILDHVSLFALAVNEENAAGGRVVTAPTNGAAGVVPAVLRYYRDFWEGADTGGLHDFLLTAGAIGMLIKRNASISGAEVGCQGEVGAASAMAAAGLAAALGGSNEQIENAAEIAMEHHLGMTCDPIAGLVQIPCIERNAFGAIKAISAASLALRGDGRHLVSLDQVIDTMRETGHDMQDKYKETSRGGLAVSFPEC